VYESIARRIHAVLQIIGGINSVLIKKCVSFTTVSIILSIACICQCPLTFNICWTRAVSQRSERPQHTRIVGQR